MFDHTNAEAAEICGVNEPVLRHRLVGEDGFLRRLPLVRDADLETGSAAELHRLLFRAIADSEARRDARRA